MYDILNDKYYKWLCDIVCSRRYSDQIRYEKLLQFLHSVEFTYLLSRDENRASDGIALRHRFSYEYDDIENADLYLTGPCSILEMLVALALRCEEDIMDDPGIGDRTKQWFWGMVNNLGLGHMDDERFDEDDARYIIYRFLDREYEPDGIGGLFTIRDCECDLRQVEIWYQLCWYLDTII